VTRSSSIGQIIGTLFPSSSPQFMRKNTLHIAGPLTFTGATAPAYIPAKITMIACFSTSLFLVFILRCTYAWENRKRDKKGEQHHVQDSEFMNLTDGENMEFRVSERFQNFHEKVLSLNSILFETDVICCALEVALQLFS
jgi:hypothetical protein